MKRTRKELKERIAALEIDVMSLTKALNRRTLESTANARRASTAMKVITQASTILRERLVVGDN